MSETFTPIDLSQLPPPNIVEPIGYESIFAEMLADLQQRDPIFTGLVESDPAFKILEVCAYRETIVRQRANDACRGIMLAYAIGADLDQIGALFGVARLSSTTITETLTLEGDLFPNIPRRFTRTLYDSGDYPTYSTDGNYTAEGFPGFWVYLQGGITGWRMDVFDDGAPTDYRFYSYGLIPSFEDFPTPDLADWSVGHNEGGATGVPVFTRHLSDPIVFIETDADFRRRIQLALEGFSVAGPKGAYIFHALSSSSAVLDVSATSPDPGEVLIAVLSRINPGTASADLVETVSNALNNEKVRPLTDSVSVISAEIVNYQVTAQIYVYQGPDSSLILDSAKAALKEYTDSVHRLGRDVSLSGIYQALHRPGVQRVNLTQPAANISISPLQASYCTAVNLTVAGTDE